MDAGGAREGEGVCRVQLSGITSGSPSLAVSTILL